MITTETQKLQTIVNEMEMDIAMYKRSLQYAEEGQEKGYYLGKIAYAETMVKYVQDMLDA